MGQELLPAFAGFDEKSETASTGMPRQLKVLHIEPGCFQMQVSCCHLQRSRWALYYEQIAIPVAGRDSAGSGNAWPEQTALE